MKKNDLKKGLCSVLACLMAVSLTACGGKDGSGSGIGGGNGGKGGDSASSVAAADPSKAKEGVFKESPITLDTEGNEPNMVYAGQFSDGVGMIYCLYEYGDDGSSSTTYYLQKFDANGNPTTKATLANVVSYYNPGFYGETEDALPLEEEEAAQEATEEASEEVSTEDMEIQPIEEPVPAPLPAGGADESDLPEVDFEYEAGYTYENYNTFTTGGDGNIYAVYSVNAEFYDEYQNWVGSKTTTSLICFDENGEQKFTTELGDFSEGYVSRLIATADGCYFIGSKDYSSWMAGFVDKNGQVSVKSENLPEAFQDINDIVRMSDGSLVMLYYTYGETYSLNACTLDLNTFTMGEGIALPGSLTVTGFNSLLAAPGGKFIVCRDTGVEMFGIGETEMTNYMNFVNSDFDGSYMRYAIPLTEDSFIGVYSSAEDYTTKAGVFTHVDPATIPDKEVITVACYYMNGELRTKVKEFNQKSATSRIVIESYEQYASTDDYMAGYTRMNNEILAGNMPDIIYVNDLDSIDYVSYAKKGLLADFSQLIAGDPAFAGQTFLTNVFDAYAVDGKQVVMLPYFDVNVYTAKPDMAQYKNWTPAEFLAFAKSLPKDRFLFEDLTRNDFMTNVMWYNGSRFLNLAEGKCDFNNEDFISLLEYSASLPEEIDWSKYDDEYYANYDTMYSSGRIVLKNGYLYNARNFYTTNYNSYFGDYTTVGFPHSEGNGAMINGFMYYMISAKSDHLQEAWDFVKTYLQPEFQDTVEYDIPVLESSYRAWLEKAKEKPSYEDENGNIVYTNDYYYVDGVEHEIPEITQAYIDEIDGIIRGVTAARTYNEDVLQIISEESSALYSGQKSAADVAAIIQSRVQLFVNENMN
ncbi:MAG: hypothetical protein K5891_03705 [Lachnospiraceae bacterium]|nr:hypothetical protein [Lachnospiraceae bacterium]